VLALRYPIADCDIQQGAQLTVREGQAIVFMAEGRFADHLGPGLHTLDIATLPLLTVLENWDTGFAAPFKSDIFYFSRRQVWQSARRWEAAMRWLPLLLLHPKTRLQRSPSFTP